MTEDARRLYKLEYVDEGTTYSEWLWIDRKEITAVLNSYNKASIRIATEEETEIYEEAYRDGYDTSSVLEYEARYDGVSFRIEVDEYGELLEEGKKMFQCAVCDEHKDFLDEVATASGFYVAMSKNHVLWHVCFTCAFNGLDRLDEGVRDWT